MPPPRGYPLSLATVGDHLRKARLDRGLLQEEVAQNLDVSLGTVVNWEQNHTAVATRFMPRVVAFLGFDPRPADDLFGERIRALRERQGLSQVALAQRLGVNASTVVAWERGRRKKLFPRIKQRFEDFLRGEGARLP
jgi:transcriptional regulator with XRE-family HTH domain